MLLPRLWDHHEDGFLESPTGEAQELKNVIERTGIRTIGFNDGEELFQIVTKKVGLQCPLASIHPVFVAEQRINFAVMAHESVGLGSIPGGKRVRRKT